MAEFAVDASLTEGRPEIEVLGAIGAGACHGLDVFERTSVKLADLFSILSWLERAELITHQDGGPAARGSYSVTGAGLSELGLDPSSGGVSYP